MSHDIILQPTQCAICGPAAPAAEVYPANFRLEDFNADIFSARRLPDKIHYRIVRCQNCGLVRSDPVIDPDTLAELYASSAQTYDAEVNNLMDSYVRYLDKAVHRLGLEPQKSRILEIGCGSGFFLEKALERGFAHVAGIEPSRQAVEKSSERVKPHIQCDVFRPDLFPAEHFDLICLFQVFDHIQSPGMLLDECRRVLKPRGGILFLNHDVRAFTARLMGERSPIIDIEHTYLYDQHTLQQLAGQHGFSVAEAGAAANKITLRYLFHLLPLPKPLKITLLAGLQENPLGKITFPIRLGNLYLIAQKPKGV